MSGNQILSDSRAEGAYNATLIGIDAQNKGFKAEQIGDGETADTDIAGIYFWNKALTAEQMAILGNIE